MNKNISVEKAVSMIKDGMSIMVAGFMAVGSPQKILEALSKTNIKNLTLICNDTAFPDKGVGLLIANKQVKKVITSHIGTNPITIEQFNNKEIEVEFVPQGTLAEKIRSAGAGLGGFLTQTGLGTVVEKGKQIININEVDYLLELPLKADIALLGASKSDIYGNLFYKGTSQNFNSVMAMAADLVIAETKEVVDEIEMESIHTSSIFVDFIVS